ncbi:MAG: hypothetical protein U0271_27640 [Polyangiaceae bacterium]
MPQHPTALRLAFFTALGACSPSSRSSDVVTVELTPVTPASSSAVLATASAFTRPDADQDLIAVVDHNLRAVANESMRVKLAGGRVTKLHTDEAYEEDFLLRDVDHVGYVFEDSWIHKHVARVFLRPNGVTRFRRGDAPWTTSTIPSVSFVFDTRDAAEESVRALSALARVTNRFKPE